MGPRTHFKGLKPLLLVDEFHAVIALLLEVLFLLLIQQANLEQEWWVALYDLRRKEANRHDRERKGCEGSPSAWEITLCNLLISGAGQHTHIHTTHTQHTQCIYNTPHPHRHKTYKHTNIRHRHHLPHNICKYTTQTHLYHITTTHTHTHTPHTYTKYTQTHHAQAHTQTDTCTHSQPRLTQ